jgi:hypothetical protein
VKSDHPAPQRLARGRRVPQNRIDAITMVHGCEHSVGRSRRVPNRAWTHLTQEGPLAAHVLVLSAQLVVQVGGADHRTCQEPALDVGQLKRCSSGVLFARWGAEELRHISMCLGRGMVRCACRALHCSATPKAWRRQDLLGMVLARPLAMRLRVAPSCLHGAGAEACGSHGALRTYPEQGRDVLTAATYASSGVTSRSRAGPTRDLGGGRRPS